MWIVVGSLVAALAVMCHALASHLARSYVDPVLIAGLESGLRQHMFHALALISVGLVAMRTKSRGLDAAGWTFTAGLVFFSGSLYVRALTGVTWVEAFTPIGGAGLMIAWIMFAWAVARLVRIKAT